MKPHIHACNYIVLCVLTQGERSEVSAARERWLNLVSKLYVLLLILAVLYVLELTKQKHTMHHTIPY